MAYVVEGAGWPFERSRVAEAEAEREADAEGAGEALGPAALIVPIGDVEGMGRGDAVG